MNWDRVQGSWKQFTGKAKEQWGKLTDDELTQINGDREQLEGKLQAKYGYAKDKAKQEVDNWCNPLIVEQRCLSEGPDICQGLFSSEIDQQF
jgi:uncharacterized protein YjbJ (UPF0337 family)